ncbi:MAG: putative n-acetylmuramoyl-l-alanine amidase [Bacillota bacterium]|nr:putative n-acetylmuramoyl-l-alanine amidase [Bacillota bacterium]
MTKKINSAAAVIFIMFFFTIMGITADAATAADVKLVINNEPVSADVMPYIQDGRTLVPARTVFEALGGTVTWDEKNYTVTVEYDSTTVILKINDKTAEVNGKTKTLDVPATINNSRTVIPARFVAEELGFLVGWNESTRTVTITSPEKTVVPEFKGYVTEVSVEEGTSKTENTVVTVQLSEALKGTEDYLSTMLTSPDRFALDVKGFQLDPKVSDLNYDQKDSPLSSVRAGTYNENSVRVVCDLKEASNPSINMSPDGKTLTITFQTLSTYFNPMEDGKLVVMLDPGHGEVTAGKQSPEGLLKEYEFNRAVAAKMKTYLEAEGIEVLLTVNDDSDPSLASRCESANNSDADIFVSIHANAFGSGKDWTSPNGWEIYHYQGSVLGNQLAKSISNANFPGIGILNRGIKTANFYVIKNTYIPAVLIEHGFFTNIDEVELLRSDEWRDKAARYNTEGIVNFLKAFN